VPNHTPAPLRLAALTTADRERTIALLSDRFAQGDLDMEQFEERVTLAHQAKNAEDLAALTADLAPSLAASAAPQVVELDLDASPSGQEVAIFGGTRREGAWKVPRRLRVVAVFGGVELDLREARLPPGPVDLDVTAAFGGVHIVVPPTLAVEVHGTAIFGGFEHMDRAPATPDPNAPFLRVCGRAFFGGVEVATRLPGESGWQAHRRRRRQRRMERHACRRLG